MIKRVFAVAMCLLMFAPVSCGRKGAKKISEAARSVEVVKVGPDKFKEPVVPSDISGSQQKINYILLNYWDGADLSDKAWVDSKDKVEEIFGNFIFYAANNPKQDVSGQAIGKILRSAESNPAFYEVLTGLIDKYLYDPNSPVRNEELYIVALESQIANANLDDAYKIVPRERLKMANKNRLGGVALDFPFTTSAGVNGTLYGIKSDYVLLFFNNPGCPACSDVRMGLIEVMQNPEIADMMKSGRLKVLTFYPDADTTEWNKYRDEIPADWINAYDARQAINNNQLYDLRAIPSLYLLDKDKKVLLKDFIDPLQFANAVLSQN